MSMASSMPIRIEEHAYTHMYQCAACSDGRSINGARTPRYEIAEMTSFVSAVATSSVFIRELKPVEEIAGLPVSVCATCISGWIAKGDVARMVKQLANSERHATYMEWLKGRNE